MVKVLKPTGLRVVAQASDFAWTPACLCMRCLACLLVPVVRLACLVLLSDLPAWSCCPTCLLGPVVRLACLVLLSDLPAWSCCPTCLLGPVVRLACLVLLSDLPAWSCCPTCLLGPVVRLACLVLLSDLQEIVLSLAMTYRIKHKEKDVSEYYSVCREGGVIAAVCVAVFKGLLLLLHNAVVDWLVAWLVAELFCFIVCFRGGKDGWISLSLPSLSPLSLSLSLPPFLRPFHQIPQTA